MDGRTTFHGANYKIQLTSHARVRMAERGITELLLIHLIENGRAKAKPQQHNAFGSIWIFQRELTTSSALRSLSKVKILL